MRPELFRLFDVGFPSYFVLLLYGLSLRHRRLRGRSAALGQNPDVMVDLGLAMLLAGVAGGRLLHVFADGFFMDYVHLCTNPSLVDWPITRAECLSPSYEGVWDAAKNVCHPKSQLLRLGEVLGRGLTYYGGFLGASVGGMVPPQA